MRIPIFVLVSLLTFSYYNWLARATGNRYHWQHDLAGYYNLLGRAFAAGQLHLPIDPSPELLALKDPWDPEANARWRLHDAVLYKGRYFLYHGAGPAIVLFTPWRLLTGHDLPENFAVVLLCFGAFLLLSGAFITLLRDAGAMPGPLLLALMLLCLAVGSGAPYLLIRAAVYEVAIAGAYFGVAGGLFCLVRSRGWLLLYVAAGMFFGLAIASRPHVGIAVAAFALLAILLRKQWKHALALAVPVVLCGAAVLAYNYARFDNPLEFGTHYQLAYARNQQRLNPSFANLYPGAYYMFLCPPHMSPVFPFIRLFTRLPPVTESLPADYFWEPTAGALLISPILLGLLLPSLRCARVIALAAFGAFLFVITIGLTTQRYQIDFVPLLLLPALTGVGVTASRWHGRRRALLLASFTAASIWTIFANAALAMSGPYDEILQRRPESWMRVAKWFTFDDRHRPMLNPAVTFAMRITPHKYGPGLGEPLIILGHYAHRWSLYLEHVADGIRLVSASNVSTERAPVLLRPETELVLRSEFDPNTRMMTTFVNGEPWIRHQLEGLVLAPSQVEVGSNQTIPFLTYTKFTGPMQVLEQRIEPRSSLLP